LRVVVVLLAGGADAPDERDRLVVPIEGEVALEAVIVVAPSRVLREERPDLFVGKTSRRPRNCRWRARRRWGSGCPRGPFRLRFDDALLRAFALAADDLAGDVERARRVFFRGPPLVRRSSPFKVTP
jgi:hypothetical protein